MKVGVIFPQTECGADVAAIAEFVRAVEAEGFDHVLVAKQAAQIDVLTGGRLRLGIGVGWNAVEYEALNETFENRGRRSAEQVAVMRALWTQQVVDFRGEFHRIDHAGLCPMPIQRPIPVWFGVGGRERAVPPDAALRRIARLADGWSPNLTLGTQGQAVVERVHGY